MVNNDAPSGLNLFVAFNQETKTAIVGIAGLNGVLGKLRQLDTAPARFDADDDGYAETTAWASAEDGILVIDEGNDNQVTQSKEIAFSKWTVTVSWLHGGDSSLRD